VRENMNLEKKIIAKDLIDRLLKIQNRNPYIYRSDPYRDFLIWGEKTYDPKKTYASIGKDYGLCLESARRIVKKVNRFLKKALKEIA
jgi:hypothetical protein